MSTGQSAGTGGGARKIGRNKIKCKRYTTRGRRETNKVRKLAKHCRAHPNDVAAHSVLKNL